MPEQYTIVSISPDELKQLISETVSEELNKILDDIKPKPEDELIKIDAVAKLLGISVVTVHAWKKQGILHFYRIANKVYFKKQEVLDSMKRIQN